MIQYKIPLLYYLKKNKGVRSLKISTNKIYAGIHWGQRQNIKERVLDTAARFCDGMVEADAYPVTICYRFVFATRGLDTLNCAYMAKMFEDAFRTLGILEDDDPKHVRETRIVVDVDRSWKDKTPSDDSGKKAVAKERDLLEVTIIPYGSRSTDIEYVREELHQVIPGRRERKVGAGNPS